MTRIAKGSRISTSKRASGVGDAELLLRSDRYKSPSDWSPDGRHLLYTVSDSKSKGDIWALPLFGDRKPVSARRHALR